MQVTIFRNKTAFLDEVDASSHAKSSYFIEQKLGQHLNRLEHRKVSEWVLSSLWCVSQSQITAISLDRISFNTEQRVDNLRSLKMFCLNIEIDDTISDFILRYVIFIASS